MLVHMLNIYLLAIALFLAALVAGNNLSVCAGPLISARMLRKRHAVAVAALGYVSGFLLEGGLVRSGIYSLTYPISAQVAFAALFTAILIFVIAHMLKVPQSLSIILMVSLLGAGLSSGAAVRWHFAAELLMFWLLIALLSMLLPFLLMRLMQRRMLKRGIWRELSGIRILLILLSFSAAFTLGANTIGIIYALIPPSATAAAGMAIAIALGALLLSSGEVRTLGEEILPMRYINAIATQLTSVIFVEVATLVSLPLSNTQTFTAGLYGTALTYKTRLLLRKPAMLILATWSATAILGFSCSYLFARLL